MLTDLCQANMGELFKLQKGFFTIDFVPFFPRISLSFVNS